MITGYEAPMREEPIGFVWLRSANKWLRSGVLGRWERGWRVEMSDECIKDG